MADRFISTITIEKLGHNIQEIRERALFNIISKLERGLVYDNELARCKEILLRLFEWFQFDSFGHENVVLDLIQRILLSNTGELLINLFGARSLQDEAVTIKNLIDSKYTDKINEIIKFLQSKVYIESVVPPLQGDVPLSYRTNESARSAIAYSTATPIEGFIEVDSSIQPLARCEKSPADTTPTNNTSSLSSLPHYYLPWQALVGSDRHVLESVANTFQNPTQPSAVLNSCEFFTDVLLHDFPAEVLLQRPSIVMLFHDLLWTCPSSRVTTAILNCLGKLTRALKNRISYHSDPCTYSSKRSCPDELAPNYNLDSSDETRNSGADSYTAEMRSVMRSQMSLPQFCLNTIISVIDYLYIPPESGDRFVRKKCEVGLSISLKLLQDAVELLKLCVTKDIWCYKDEELVGRNLNRINEVFEKFAAVIQHFRLEVMASDWNEESRMIHLHLLCNFTVFLNHLVPLDKCDSILPRAIKNAVASSILDPSFSRLFPEVHEMLLIITKQCNTQYESDSFRKYEQIKSICSSMTNTIIFLRDWKALPMIRNMTLAKSALICLEFHADLNFITIFIDLCANKLSLHSFEEDVIEQIDDILVSLLAHQSEDIKLRTYNLCQKKVVATIGAKLNTTKTSSPGNQVVFLLRSKVLEEIAVHGLLDPNLEIQTCAENILIHILKCKILVSQEIWQQAVESVIPIIPILICNVNKTILGRTVLSVLDPDKSQTLNVPLCEIIKGNAGLLFSETSQIRVEAISRLCWLLSSSDEKRKLLPHINNLHDKALAVVCCLDRQINYNRLQSAQHFYQPSGLHQVIELLNSENVEPVIRRSAVTQISVMMEDPILHLSFIDRGGVDTILHVMKSALTESNYMDYPDSVIGCISVLKNVCLYNATARQELANDLKVYQYLLRGMFMFCTEERVKQDGSTLLFLLIYSNYILGSPTKNDLSLPECVVNLLKCPFLCETHWTTSKNSLPTLMDITSDKWALSSLQIHWNTEWFGGLQKILKLKTVTYEKSIHFHVLLKLTNNDLLAIRSTSIEYSIEKYLKAIESGKAHTSVMSYLSKLTNCVNLYNIIIENSLGLTIDFHNFHWERAFERYLSTPPSGEDDNLMLARMFQFLTILVPIFKISDKSFWVSSILKNKTHYFTDLLSSDCVNDDDMKQLLHSLLDLIKSCVCKEQHYLDFQANANGNKNSNDESWSHIANIIIEHLQFNDAQHFYNLAYLDHLLSTLVHLTSKFGWSNSNANEVPKKMLKQLAAGLFELIESFHCGKGAAAANSLMGLSITRHVALILDQTLGEMQNSNVKNWEECFMVSDAGESNLTALCQLARSKDTMLRASIYHLLAGMALSARVAVELVQDIKMDRLDIWEIAMSVITNDEEASVIKENAAMLLTNLVAHTTTVSDNLILIKSISPTKWKDCDANTALLKLLTDYNFYEELTSILNNICVEKMLYIQDLENLHGKNTNRTSNLIFYKTSARSTDTEVVDKENLYINTPGVVKYLALFTHNVFALEPQHLCSQLQEYGLIKLFLKCLTVPKVDIITTKDLALYCDILEMNAAICLLLSRTVVYNNNCLMVVCNTRDYFSVMMALLNPNLYYTSLPQLIYLRDKLWCSIYNLVNAILINNESEKVDFDIYQIISVVIHDIGQQTFLQSLCESINTKISYELQLAALSSFTSLLCVSSFKQNTSPHSMQTLLDTTRTPRTSNIAPNNCPKNGLTSLNVLQNVYFGATTRLSQQNNSSSGQDQMAGAELCRILMHLYELIHLKNSTYSPKNRIVIINALSTLLSVSSEAKSYALNSGLLPKIVDQIKEIHIKLSLESVDCLRRASDKKRVCPILNQLEQLIGMLTNFMYECSAVKDAAATCGLADVSHKLWVWLLMQKPLLVCALQMLCTFTTNCSIACQSMPLTSPVAGSGPRKTPGNISLLQAVCTLVAKEMEQISRSHDLAILQLCFNVLHNCISVVECRLIIIKNNMLQSLSRLHPAITKRQKPWENVETIWLNFLDEFTSYPEGQASIGKFMEVLDLVMAFTASNKMENREMAMEVLRNIAFYPTNRSRLLTCDEFIALLLNKLSTGTINEKNIIVSILWTLAANNQKAKLVFKCAHIDSKLQEVIKVLKISNAAIEDEDMERMEFVLGLLKDGDKVR